MNHSKRMTELGKRQVEQFPNEKEERWQECYTNIGQCSGRLCVHNLHLLYTQRVCRRFVQESFNIVFSTKGGIKYVNYANMK